MPVDDTKKKYADECGFVITDDECIRRKGSEEILYYSVDKFIEVIVKTKNCFMCGVSPDSADFDNEHIVPNWLLREFKIHNAKITLPNNTFTQYSKYTIRCCKNCNKLLNREYEVPISNIIKGGFEQIQQAISTSKGRKLFFCWMALIFIKKHLKDREYPLERNPNKSDGRTIAEEHHDFVELHHIYCLARQAFSKAHINPNVYGTLFVLEAELYEEKSENYSSDSNTNGSTMMLRINDACIFVVFNDMQTCCIRLAQRGFFPGVDIGPLSFIQAKEIFTHLAYTNLSMTTRPSYGSGISRDCGYIISGRIPEGGIELKDNFELLSFMLSHMLKATLPHDIESIERLERGELLTYLKNDDGTFNKTSLKRI